MMVRKTWQAVAITAIVLLGLIQFVPFGRNHTNPPVVEEPGWDSLKTRGLAERACFDCHSNETVWPWYSSIAPVSWLVVRDVTVGRDEMNFSDWGRTSQRATKVIREIEEGAMPPAFYLPLHPEARLTADEKAQLIEGLRKSLP